MTQVHIEIKNIQQIRNAFSKAPRLMEEEFKQALTKSAILIQRESMSNSPVLTGRLRASHKFDIKGSGLKMEAEVGPDVNYAIFVHEGTRFMPARPFLKEAAESSLQEIDYFFTTAVQNALDKVGRLV